MSTNKFSTNMVYVIKIGGNVLDNPAALSSFLADFSSIQHPKILVHGGGKIATGIGEKLGIVPQYLNGRRITDAQTLDVVTMVYGGLVNKQVVAQLQHLGCNALGLTGADGNIIHAKKRPVKEVDYGFVGDIKPHDVHVELLDLLLSKDIVPVFAPLTHADGNMLNTNADTIASVLAIALGARHDVRLIYCFEKKGILMDVNDPSSVIRHLPRPAYEQLLPTGVFFEGILPKLENAFSAIGQGVKEVLIGDAKDIVKNTGSETEGTLITS